MADTTDQDIQHALFVQQQERYAVALDTTIKARNSAATDLSIDTQLDGPTAQALAAAYLADGQNPRVFEIELEGTIDLEAFIGGPPSYVPGFPKLATDGRTMKVFSVSTDYDANTTTIQVRG